MWTDIVTVSEEAIVASMRTIWETMKIIVEPSAAVPYAGNSRTSDRCEPNDAPELF
jgi:threonine dehydratase